MDKQPDAIASVTRLIVPPEEVKGFVPNIWVFFGWFYTNVFYGVLTIIITLVAAAILDPAPMTDKKSMAAGLAVLSATVCMTNTSFPSELRAFFPQYQERLSIAGQMVAVIVLIPAVLIHTSPVKDEIVLPIMSVFACLSAVIGFWGHKVSLTSKMSYFEGLINEAWAEIHNDYAQELQAAQEQMQNSAKRFDNIDGLRI